MTFTPLGVPDHDHDSLYYRAEVVDAALAALGAEVGMRPRHAVPRTGEMITTVEHGFGRLAAIAGGTQAANAMRIGAIYLGTDKPVVRAYVNVTTPAAAGGLVRVGIHRWERESGLTISRDLDCGDIDTTQAGLRSTTLFSFVPPEPDWYWLSIVPNLNVGLSMVSEAAFGLYMNTSLAQIAAMTRAEAYGPLAATHTMTGASTTYPVIGLEVGA